jgi:hypothetical protein
MVMIEARYPALAGLENPRYNAALCGSKLSDGRRLEKRRVAGPRRKIWDWKGRDLRNCSQAGKNPHVGSSFESWLEDAGIREEVTAAAIKAVIARQLAPGPQNVNITPVRARSIP